MYQSSELVAKKERTVKLQKKGPNCFRNGSADISDGWGGGLQILTRVRPNLLLLLTG